jgi:hypothetical protein
MAFVVEDGTGKVDANSYESVANARAYWLDVGVTFTQTDQVLQQSLVASTRYIELRYGSRFKGEPEFPATENPVFAGQALSFPRLCLVNRYGVAVTGVPVQVRHATSEYMKRALTAELAPDPSLAGNLISNREKVGPLETEVVFVPGSVPRFKPYPTADALLIEFIYSSDVCYR